MTQCTDPVIGKILAGWRYDISGLAPEMGGDYEAHLATCSFCHSRQRLHRAIDIGLMALASVSMFVFLLAYGVIRHFDPPHAFLLEVGALGGFLLSMLLWLLVYWRHRTAFAGIYWAKMDEGSPAKKPAINA